MTETCLHHHHATNAASAPQQQQQANNQQQTWGAPELPRESKKRRLSATETYAADAEFAAFLLGSGERRSRVR